MEAVIGAASPIAQKASHRAQAESRVGEDDNVCCRTARWRARGTHAQAHGGDRPRLTPAHDCMNRWDQPPTPTRRPRPAHRRSASASLADSMYDCVATLADGRLSQARAHDEGAERYVGCFRQCRPSLVATEADGAGVTNKPSKVFSAQAKQSSALHDNEAPHFGCDLLVLGQFVVSSLPYWCDFLDHVVGLPNGNQPALTCSPLCVPLARPPGDSAPTPHGERRHARRLQGHLRQGRPSALHAFLLRCLPWRHHSRARGGDREHRGGMRSKTTQACLLACVWRWGQRVRSSLHCAWLAECSD